MLNKELGYYNIQIPEIEGFVYKGHVVPEVGDYFIKYDESCATMMFRILEVREVKDDTEYHVYRKLKYRTIHFEDINKKNVDIRQKRTGDRIIVDLINIGRDEQSGQVYVDTVNEFGVYQRIDPNEWEISQ